MCIINLAHPVYDHDIKEERWQYKIAIYFQLFPLISKKIKTNFCLDISGTIGHFSICKKQNCISLEQNDLSHLHY